MTTITAAAMGKKSVLDQCMWGLYKDKSSFSNSQVPCATISHTSPPIVPPHEPTKLNALFIQDSSLPFVHLSTPWPTLGSPTHLRPILLYCMTMCLSLISFFLTPLDKTGPSQSFSAFGPSAPTQRIAPFFQIHQVLNLVF